MHLRRVDYRELNGKQKEIYNFQKVAARLADYGFNCIKLDDDWMGADFLAYHKDGVQTLRVQLKGRLTISKKYSGKDLYLCFRHQDNWYLVPHDTLVDIAGLTTKLAQYAFLGKGQYSSANPSQKTLKALADYRLE